MYRPSFPTPVAASAALLLASAAGTALGADATYCVTCKNPDATYRCSVNAGGSKPTDALKLYCVIRIAKEDHHASCSAIKSDTCNGIDRVYSYDGPLPEDFASDAHVKKFKDQIEQQQKTFDKPKSDTPDTLVELTGRAVSASRNRIRSARGALTGSESSAQPLPQGSSPSVASAAPVNGDASAPPPPGATAANSGEHASLARRSYRCVMSFFRNCSNTAQ